jgi:hypothetical protein
LSFSETISIARSGTKSRTRPLAVDQKKFRGSNERHIRPVRVAIEVEILLRDDYSKRFSLDSEDKSHNQKIAKKVVASGIARHVKQAFREPTRD